jgi:asparagine synthase (glutamine-hydrolysing)
MAGFFLAKNADMPALFLKPDAIRKIWRDHVSGSQNYKYVIWILLTVAVWAEKEGII